VQGRLAGCILHGPLPITALLPTTLDHAANFLGALVGTRLRRCWRPSAGPTMQPSPWAICLDLPPQSGNFVAPEDSTGAGTRSVSARPQADGSGAADARKRKSGGRFKAEAPQG
jgi:hypothetical protein